jgi:hypothetical protein
MVCTSLLCDKPLPRNNSVVGFHGRHKIHCTDTYQTRICLFTVRVQNPTRHRLMIGSGAHQAPCVARLQASKRASGGLVTNFHTLAKFRILKSQFLSSTQQDAVFN